MNFFRRLFKSSAAKEERLATKKEDELGYRCSVCGSRFRGRLQSVPGGIVLVVPFSEFSLVTLGVKGPLTNNQWVCNDCHESAYKKKSQEYHEKNKDAFWVSVAHVAGMRGDLAENIETLKRRFPGADKQYEEAFDRAFDDAASRHTDAERAAGAADLNALSQRLIAEVAAKVTTAKSKAHISELRGYYAPIGVAAAFAQSAVSITPELERQLISKADAERDFDGSLLDFYEAHGIAFAKEPEGECTLLALEDEYRTRTAIIWVGETQTGRFTIVVFPNPHDDGVGPHD